MAPRRDWGRWQRKEITPERVDEIAGNFRRYGVVKAVARISGVPPGILRRWLEAGEGDILACYENENGRKPEPEGVLFEACEKARGELVAELFEKLREAGAGKDSAPGAAGWLLERIESDEFGAKTSLEVSGADGGPLELDGRIIGGFADLAAVALAVDQGHLFGLSPGSAERALPAASEVLPDLLLDEPSAVSPADVHGS